MFREFKVGELFDVHPTKAYKLNNSGLLSTAGSTPVVVNSSQNNGIGGYSELEPTEAPGILTFSDTTTGQNTLFYQSQPFIGYPHVQGMYPKNFKFNNLTALFMIATLRATLGKRKWDYSNKLNRAIVIETQIQLPVKPGTDEVNYTEDDIDWAYMESYIHELEESYIQELDAYLKETGLDDYTLTDDEREVLEREPVFKEFEVGELFETYTVSKKLTKAALSLNGTVPVYSSDTRNNGVLGYTEQVPTFIVNAVQPTYVIFGDHTRTINIVHESFCVMDNVKVLSPKFDLSDETLLYIKTVWLKGIPVLGYARHWSVAKDVALFLPVKQGTDEVNYNEDDIDWDYMAAYVRATEKQVIADVVDYKNEVIATTKALVEK